VTETKTLVLRFRIGGRLAWLSHRETMTLWQRALVRAQVPLVYSEGFSPHPRMSLPLPRSVGLATDDDLLCAQVQAPGSADGDPSDWAIVEQLPQDCVMEAATLEPGRVGYEATGANYVFRPATESGRVRAQRAVEHLQDRLAAGEAIPVQRAAPNGKGPSSRDAGRFLMEATWEIDYVRLRCRIGPQGTVRVDEMFQLLELTPADLAGPVVRTRVEWVRKGKEGKQQ